MTHPKRGQGALKDRFRTKKPAASLRLLIASLSFHVLALSTILLINDSRSAGSGTGISANEGTFSVTWIPGNGQSGGKGVDTTIPDEDAGNSLDVINEPVESTPAPQRPKLLSVTQTDPQAVFNAESPEALALASAETSRIPDFAVKPNDSVRNQKSTASATASPSASTTHSDGDDDELDIIPGQSKGRGSGGEKQGSGESGPGNGRASFFGIVANSKRIVYVIDASESMGQHNAMAIARRELWNSLKQLAPASQFQIVFFNLTNHTMNRPGERWQLLPATSSNLRLAKQFLKGIQPDSGTDRFQAISFALSLNPDVVFVLTDADSPQLSAQDLFELQRSNKRKSRIHVIEFGVDADLGGDSFLKKLARQNGGTHLYRDLMRMEQ